jgi:uncharacterized protein (TIGR02300 family)
VPRGLVQTISEVKTVAKPELGNKHQCQQCGTKFFDLNKTPVVCPKCGTIFHAVALSRAAQRATATVEEDDVEAEGAPELVSLEDAEADADKVAVVVDDDVEVEDEAADDTFLEEEEEDPDDVTGLIDGDLEDDEER